MPPYGWVGEVSVLLPPFYCKYSMVKNMFGIFKRKEPPFDESSDCFLAMQYWLKKYEEDEGWLYIQRIMTEE